MAIKLRDLVARLRLVLDRDAAKEAEAGASGSFERIKANALKLGAAIAGSFAIHRIAQWSRAVIDAAREADAIWNRLAGTLSTVGIEFAAVENEVKAAARAMQDATTVGDEEFADILGELTSISRDYTESLRNVGVVTDLAAAKQIDFRTAAQLVGRAMIGETALLKRYGIIVAEGSDAVETMRRQFAGMAANEANTLSGKITQMSNEWGDFKEALGTALLEVSNGAGVIDIMIGTLKRATRAVEDLYKITLSMRIGAAIITRNPAALAGATAELAELEKQIEERQREALRNEELRRLGFNPGESAEARAERLRLAAEKAREEARVAAEARQKAFEEFAGKPGQSLLRPGEIGVIGEEQLQGTPTGILIRQLDEIPPKIETVQSAFQSMFGLITMDAQTAIDALAGIGVALVEGGLSGIGRYANMKSKLAAVQAIEELAAAAAAFANPVKAALTGDNPALHLKAAAEYAGVAAAWRALGGAFGGGGGGSASRGGGFTSTSRDLGGRQALNTQPRTSVNIYIDPLNPYAPAYQRNIAAVERLARENYGAIDVQIHPATGR